MKITRKKTMSIYSFDLTNFEDGEFTATRFADNCAVSGDWVCHANGDLEALKLAEKAALEEWAAPETRSPKDFRVEFFDSTTRKLTSAGNAKR